MKKAFITALRSPAQGHSETTAVVRLVSPGTCHEHMNNSTAHVPLKVRLTKKGLIRQDESSKIVPQVKEWFATQAAKGGSYESFYSIKGVFWA